MNKIISREKSPVFGVLSILFPILGAVIGFLMARTAKGNGEGWAEFTALAHYFVFGVALGFIAALISLVRSEKYLFLPLIGFVVNVLPIVWFFFDNCLHSFVS